MDATLKAELVSYEWLSLEALEEEHRFDERLVDGFGQSFLDLRDLCRQATDTADGEFRAGRIVVMGLTNQAHLLLIGGLRALGDGNVVVWSACVRGLVEVFGACVLIRDKRSFAPTLLDHVKAGRLYAAAERSLPGLGSDIKRLNEVVHPGARAMYAGHRMVDPHASYAEFKYGLSPLPQAEAREGITVLANMAHHIVEKLKLIVADGVAFQEGKVIMGRPGRD